MTTFDDHVKATGTHDHDWHLLTDSQEVEAVCQSIGFLNEPCTLAEYPEPLYSHMFVTISDGEYTRVIACEGSVAWVWSEYDVLLDTLSCGRCSTPFRTNEPGSDIVGFDGWICPECAGNGAAQAAWSIGYGG